MVAETIDTTASPTPSGVMSTIQALRAFAALDVVMIHFEAIGRPLGLWPVSGGVDIFFVISGFVMVYTTRGKHIGPGAFALNRVIRVVPLYWFMTFVTVAAALILPMLFKNTTADPASLFKSLFFIPFSKDGEVIRPALFVGWTLNYEMFFYALFTAGLFARNYLAGMCCVVTALAGLVALGLAMQPTDLVWKFYTDPILLEFGAGMAVGWFATRSVRQSRKISRLCWLALGILALFAATYSGYLVPGVHPAVSAGIPAAVLIFAAVQFERNGGAIRSRLALLLGDASYSLYLTHPFAASAVKLAHSRLKSESWSVDALLLITGLIVCCAVAIVSYMVFERPVTRWLRRRLHSAGLVARFQRHGNAFEKPTT